MKYLQNIRICLGGGEKIKKLAYFVAVMLIFSAVATIGMGKEASDTHTINTDANAVGVGCFENLDAEPLDFTVKKFVNTQGKANMAGNILVSSDSEENDQWPAITQDASGRIVVTWTHKASILESNIEDIISPFLRRMSSRYLRLTPAQIQVANLVRQGKRTKEIAEMLYLSPKTIEDYRKNLRQEFGLRNKKINLRTHLLSIK